MSKGAPGNLGAPSWLERAQRAKVLPAISVLPLGEREQRERREQEVLPAIPMISLRERDQRDQTEQDQIV
jgi:hypothetical protein